MLAAKTSRLTCHHHKTHLQSTTVNKEMREEERSVGGENRREAVGGRRSRFLGRRRDISGLPEYFWVVGELFLGGGCEVVVG